MHGDRYVSTADGRYQDHTDGLINIIENRRHSMREVAEVLERSHEVREISRQLRKAEMRRPSKGVGSVEGDLILARESEISIF